MTQTKKGISAAEWLEGMALASKTLRRVTPTAAQAAAGMAIFAKALKKDAANRVTTS